MDYRVLNKETALDKFSIHMIDELLEELFRVEIFSTIDLKLR